MAARHVHPNDLIPAPGRCARKADTSHGRDLRRCGAALSTTTTLRLREDHGALAVQSAILRPFSVMSSRTGSCKADPVPVHSCLADLAAVGGRILGYAALSDLEDLIPADLLDAYRCAMTSPPSRERRGASARGHCGGQTAVAAVLAVDRS